MGLTPTKGYTKPTVGAAFNLWGDQLNTNFDYIDDNIGGMTVVDVSGNVDVTASASQARHMLQDIDGALTGNISYVLPNTSSYYAIANNTTGNFNLFVKTVSGSGVYVAQGSSMWVYSDGVNIVRATPIGWQEIATYTASSVASVPFFLPQIFRRFRLTLQRVSVSTGPVNLFCQVSDDGGSTFKNSAYVWVFSASDNTNATTVLSSTNGGGVILSPGLHANGNANVYDATVEIFPGSASENPSIRSTGFGQGTTTLFYQVAISGLWQAGGLAVNAISIFPDAGTFSGTLILEGLP